MQTVLFYRGFPDPVAASKGEKVAGTKSYRFFFLYSPSYLLIMGSHLSDILDENVKREHVLLFSLCCS